ncbi:MAG: hypothetical protein JO209_03805 [Acidisphaera sp.]|nr:hypothetical protein [Acidisphaera sp.]
MITCGRIAAASTGLAAAAMLLSACANQSTPPAASASPAPAPIAAAPPPPPPGPGPRPGMGSGQGSGYDGVYAGNVERAGAIGSARTRCEGNMYHPQLRVRGGQASIHWFGDDLSGPVSPDGRLSLSGANSKINGSFSGATFNGQIETQYCRYTLTATKG